MEATHPTVDGKEYHLRTGPGDLPPHCLLVGHPGRARMIGERYLRGTKVLGENRGLTVVAGNFKIDELPSVEICVVTTGMGGPSAGIVLPEAVRSGARRFIRVGSCAAIQPGPKPGDLAIATGSVRFDGASGNWAPPEYPAVPDFRVVSMLEKAARDYGATYHLGIGVTTSDFNEGQARPDDSGYVPQRLLARHDELAARGALFYNMEDAAVFVWCGTHGGYWSGSVNAIYANRVTGALNPSGDEAAAGIALVTLARMARQYPLD